MQIARPTTIQTIPEDAKRVFNGKIFDVYQWEQELFDGSKVTFEKLKRPDTAYTIPITSDQKLILVEQTQPGRTPYVGLLGGRIEHGETAEEGARRELLEEAGIKAGQLILWESFQFLPKIDWAIYCFVARDIQVVRKQSLDPGERMKLIYVTFDEFIDLVSQEKFTDVEVALKVLRIEKNTLRLNEIKRLFFD